MQLEPQDQGCFETFISLFFGMMLLIAMLVIFI